MKLLYTFTVTKKELVEESTPQEDGSTVVRKVEKDVPVEIRLKLPSRRDREQIAFIYDGEYGKAIKGGLQPVDVLRRCLLDSGGAIAQKDLERAEELLKLIRVKENERTLAIVENENADISTLEEELKGMYNEFQVLEKLQREIYSRSAESRAEMKTVEWCVLSMTYCGDAWVFPGVTDESRLTTYYDFCDDEENHKWEIEAYNKATVIFYHHIVSGQTDQKYFDKLLDEL